MGGCRLGDGRLPLRSAMVGSRRLAAVLAVPDQLVVYAVGRVLGWVIIAVVLVGVMAVSVAIPLATTAALIGAIWIVPGSHGARSTSTGPAKKRLRAFRAVIGLRAIQTTRGACRTRATTSTAPKLAKPSA